MNYTEINEAVKSGTISVESEGIVANGPWGADEKITVSIKQWNRMTGQPVEPLVQSFYKNQLNNEKKSTDDQVTGLQKNSEAMAYLLSQF